MMCPSPLNREEFLLILFCFILLCFFGKRDEFLCMYVNIVSVTLKKSPVQTAPETVIRIGRGSFLGKREQRSCR